MQFDDKHDKYIFKDFLKSNYTRSQAEYRLHRQKQRIKKHTYDPDPEKIDFQGVPQKDRE